MPIATTPFGFIIRADNNFLHQDIQAFYHADYVGHKNPGNPDYINDLKNTYDDFKQEKLTAASQKLREALSNDFPNVLIKLGLPSIVACVVPRAKTQYSANQLLFKATVKAVVNTLRSFSDGTEYIQRHRNTRTTHLKNEIPNYNNDGSYPYPGITQSTCIISEELRDKDVLLIDDLYTYSVKIDEDAIQALINTGVKSVCFYSIGRTVPR